MLNLDFVDSFLKQAVQTVAETYQAECLLWVGLSGSSMVLRGYATPGFWSEFDDTSARSAPVGSLTADAAVSRSSVAVVYPSSLPMWLLDQRRSPQMGQLETGDLIIPIFDQTLRQDASPAVSDLSTLQLVVQLRRWADGTAEANVHASREAGAQQQASRAGVLLTSTIEGWAADTLGNLQRDCHDLGLTYSALYWQHQLKQSRRQIALIGRITHLLNSSLNPDEMVEQIVAELGQGVEGDRCVLVNLGDVSGRIIASWESPDSDWMPLKDEWCDRIFWRDVGEAFLQDGASYLHIERSESGPESFQSWLRAIAAASVLIMPLFIQSELFGAVCLLSYAAERDYQLDELQTARQVADLVAIAVNNLRHYQHLWHKQEALRLNHPSRRANAARDYVTHLLNRDALDRELEHLSSKALWTVQPTFCVILCDIDYFKLINDTYGHQVGDEVLKVLARRLQHQLRQETPAYRYGGEEFVIILTETTLTHAIDVAERLRQHLRSKPVETSAGLVEVTASFGVAQQDAVRDHHAWDVLRVAEQAMFEAKRDGRDCVKAL